MIASTSPTTAGQPGQLLRLCPRLRHGVAAGLGPQRLRIVDRERDAAERQPSPTAPDAAPMTGPAWSTSRTVTVTVFSAV